jgi:type II secretory pathway pseudopilin PulG
MFSKKRRGVTDVPLELVIIMVILAIVIPIIIAAFASYTKEQEGLSLQEQAANVADTAIQVYDGGLNTTLLVSVTIPNGGSMTIGASLQYANGLSNPGASCINISIPSQSWQCYKSVNNGAGTINLANVTDISGGIFTQAAPLSGGQTYTLALTKLSPGAIIFGGLVVPGADGTFVWVQVVGH